MTALNELETIIHRKLTHCSNELIQHCVVKGFVDYMEGKRTALLDILEVIDIIKPRVRP